MTSAHEIVTTMRADGLALEIVDGGLRAGPRERLTEAQRSILRRYRDLIVEHLEAEAAETLLEYHCGDCPVWGGGECACSPTIAPPTGTSGEP